MAFKVVLTDVAEEGLEALRVYDRRRVAAAIDKQLQYQPTRRTRNRKRLMNVSPDFDFDPPLMTSMRMSQLSTCERFAENYGVRRQGA